MPLEPGMIPGPHRQIKTYTYTLDAHGGIRPRTNISPPLGIQIVFYSRPSYLLCTDPGVKSQLCDNPVAHFNDIKEMVENKAQAATGFPFIYRPRLTGETARQIQYSYTCEDYMFTADNNPVTNGGFYSGVKDCSEVEATKNIIINLYVF